MFHPLVSHIPYQMLGFVIGVDINCIIRDMMIRSFSNYLINTADHAVKTAQVRPSSFGG